MIFFLKPVSDFASSAYMNHNWYYAYYKAWHTLSFNAKKLLYFYTICWIFFLKLHINHFYLLLFSFCAFFCKFFIFHCFSQLFSLRKTFVRIAKYIFLCILPMYKSDFCDILIYTMDIVPFSVTKNIISLYILEE